MQASRAENPSAACACLPKHEIKHIPLVGKSVCIFPGFSGLPRYTLGVCRIPDSLDLVLTHSPPHQCDLGTALTWSSLSATVFLNWNCEQFWGEIIGLAGTHRIPTDLCAADLLGQIRGLESTLLRGIVSGVGRLLGDLPAPLAVLQTSLENIL